MQHEPESKLEEYFLNNAPLFLENLLISQFQLGGYRYDFCIPSYNILIECDSKQYHSSEQSKINDQKKDQNAKQYKYVLFRFSGPAILGNTDACFRFILKYMIEKGIICNITDILKNGLLEKEYLNFDVLTTATFHHEMKIIE